MTQPGDEYDCEICGDTHVIREDDAADGVSAALGRRHFSVECPESGVIAWDE